ncbi:glycosyltransferase family 2 protein [bacterium]
MNHFITKKTAIIIVTYKALPYVKQCVQSIKEHTKHPYELIIIDNNSGPEMVSYLRSLQDITLIENQDNRLLTPAQNQGLDKISKDVTYVLFLNPDIQVLQDGWLTEMIDLIESKENIGSVGPVCNYHPLGPLKGNIDMCCMLVRREVLDACSGLDNQYPWNGGGLILTAHAWSKGWRYAHLRQPKIVIHHKAKSRSYKQLPNQPIDQRVVFQKYGLKPVWSFWGFCRQLYYHPETVWNMIKAKFS